MNDIKQFKHGELVRHNSPYRQDDIYFARPYIKPNSGERILEQNNEEWALTRIPINKEEIGIYLFDAEIWDLRMSRTWAVVLFGDRMVYIVDDVLIKVVRIKELNNSPTIEHTIYNEEVRNGR